MIRACFSTAGTELEARTHGAGGSGQTGGSHSQAVTNQQQQSGSHSQAVTNQHSQSGSHSQALTNQHSQSGSHSQALTNQQQQCSIEIKVYKIFSMFLMSMDSSTTVNHDHLKLYIFIFNPID